MQHMHKYERMNSHTHTICTYVRTCTLYINTCELQNDLMSLFSFFGSRRSSRSPIGRLCRRPRVSIMEKYTVLR